MLVMTTIFTSVMEKLPLTSYPKMIDFWLIFCQLVPFTEVREKFTDSSCKVVLLTAMEFLRDESVDEAESQTKETSKDVGIIHSGGEKGSNPGNSAVELDKPEAWSDHQKGGTKKGTIGNWLKVIGRRRECIRYQVGSFGFIFFQRRRCCLVPCSSLV